MGGSVESIEGKCGVFVALFCPEEVRVGVDSVFSYSCISGFRLPLIHLL